MVAEAAEVPLDLEEGVKRPLAEVLLGCCP